MKFPKFHFLPKDGSTFAGRKPFFTFEPLTTSVGFLECAPPRPSLGVRVRVRPSISPQPTLLSLSLGGFFSVWTLDGHEMGALHDVNLKDARDQHARASKRRSLSLSLSSSSLERERERVRFRWPHEHAITSTESTPQRVRPAVRPPLRRPSPPRCCRLAHEAPL